jgi:TPP-dependent pyruvate/acetoin dehydrogenase alpha subunit
MADWLMDEGLLSEKQRQEMENEVLQEVSAAVAFAEQGTDEPTSQLERFVNSR